jgi:hypothetical protein
MRGRCLAFGKGHARGAMCYDASMAKRLEPFDAVAFGPGPRDIVMRRQPPGDITRLVRWTRQHHWTAQIVLWLGAVTVCYLALVFGLLVGAGIAPWLD